MLLRLIQKSEVQKDGSSKRENNRHLSVVWQRVHKDEEKSEILLLRVCIDSKQRETAS